MRTREFQRLVDELTERYPYYKTVVGAELARALNRVVDQQNTASAYGNIAKMVKYADDVGKARGIGKSEIIDADPLAITKILSELHSSKSSPLDEATVLAAIGYTRFRIRRANPFAMPDKNQLGVIFDNLEQIGGRPATDTRKKIRPLFSSTAVSSEVEELMRNTLQLSEINRGGGVSGTPAANTINPPQTEEELNAAFLHMIMEAVKDPRAVEIRGAQFLADMRAATEEYRQKPTEENACRVQEFDEQANKVYIPMVSAYGYDVLREKIQDQQFWMLNPDRYKEIVDMIVTTAKDIAPAGKREYVTDLQTALRIVNPDLEELLQPLIPREFQGQVRIISDIKKPASTSNKIGKKGKAYDIVRLRMEVTLPLPQNASGKADWVARGDLSDDEVFTPGGGACRKILAAIDAEANKNKGLSHVPDEERYRTKYKEMKAARKAQSDGRIPTQDEVVQAIREEDNDPDYNRPLKNYYKKPKKNGYRAIHIHLMRNVEYEKITKDPKTGEEIKTTEIRSTRFEIQIVDVLTHNNNKHGPPAHSDRYKGLPSTPDSNAPFTVSAFTPNNEIRQLSLPATATDFIFAHHGADIALQSNTVFIKKHPSNFFSRDLYPDRASLGDDNPFLVEGHDKPVHTGDTVLFTMAPDLLKDAQHMQHVIDSCRVPGTKQALERRRNQLVAMSQSAGVSSRPGDEETSTPATRAPS